MKDRSWLILLAGLVAIVLGVSNYMSDNWPTRSPSMAINVCNAPVDGATATWDASIFCLRWVAP